MGRAPGTGGVGAPRPSTARAGSPTLLRKRLPGAATDQLLLSPPPLPGSTVDDDRVIGFNASANDDTNADGVRDLYLSWVDENLPYWADTRVYGQLTLVDQS